MSFEDRYALLVPLGETVRGEVWSAKDQRDDKTVAIAILDEDASEEVRSHFLSIHLAAKLGGSPGMVRVIETGTTGDGRLYAALEHVEGESLRARLEKGPPLRLDQLVRAMIEILEALASLHDQDLAHGDVSVGNVLLREKGSRLSKRLIGLGMGRARIRAGEEPLDDAEQLIELAFMSPAQARGETVADPASDTYSVAAVLYAAITGFLPHYGETAGALRDDVIDGPVWSAGKMRPDVASPLSEVVDQALGPEGFASANDLANALRAALLRSPRLSKLETPVGPLKLARGEEPSEAAAEPKGRWSKTKPSVAKVGKPGAIPKPGATLPSMGGLPKPGRGLGAIPKPGGAIPKPGGGLPPRSKAVSRPGAIPKPGGAIPELGAKPAVAEPEASKPEVAQPKVPKPEVAKPEVAEPPRAPGVPEPAPEAFDAPTKKTPAAATAEETFEAPTRPSLVAPWPREDAPVGEIERLSEPPEIEAIAEPKGGLVDVGALMEKAAESDAAAEPDAEAEAEAAAEAEPETEAAEPEEPPSTEELIEEDFEEVAKPPSVPPAAFEPADASKTPSFPPDEVIPPRTVEPAPSGLDEPVALPTATMPKWIWGVAALVGLAILGAIAVALSGGDDDPPEGPTATLPSTAEPTPDPTPDPVPEVEAPPDSFPEPEPVAVTDDAVHEVEVAFDQEPPGAEATPAVLEGPVPEPEADGVTRMRLSGVPEGANIYVDGRRVDGPDLEIPAGTESALIEVRLAGHRTWRRRLLLAVPDQLPVHLEPETETPPAPPPTTTTGGGGRPSSRGGRRRRSRPTIVTDPGF